MASSQSRDRPEGDSRIGSQIIDDVAPDGSPVAVYRAMPPHDALDMVADHVPEGGSVLDLGCGVGRLANPLAEAGFTVTGVDHHEGMTQYLSPAVEALTADIIDLDLRRTYDVVVLASHLINHPTHALEFARTCARHVATDGVVLIERFEPTLLDDDGDRHGEVDGVHVWHEIHRRDGHRFSASAHYTVRGRTWTQRYSAALLDDDALAALLDAAGLTLVEWLDEDDRWLSADVRDKAGGERRR